MPAPPIVRNWSNTCTEPKLPVAVVKFPASASVWLNSAFAYNSGYIKELTTVGWIPAHHRKPFRNAMTTIAHGWEIIDCNGNWIKANNCSGKEPAILIHIPLIINNTVTIKIPGIKAVNALITIGGTLCGILIVKFFFTHQRKISVEIVAANNAVRIPFVPNQSNCKTLPITSPDSGARTDFGDKTT